MRAADLADAFLAEDVRDDSDLEGDLGIGVFVGAAELPSIKVRRVSRTACRTPLTAPNAEQVGAYRANSKIPMSAG